MRPTHYEIVVLGELSDRFALAFEGMEVRTQAGRTTISGLVVDQAQLHGLIDRVGDLGLDLLDLRVVDVGHDTPPGRRPAPTSPGRASGARP